MLTHMRTTLLIEDHLMIQAKHQAAIEHTSVSKLMNRALEHYFAGPIQLREQSQPYRVTTHGAGKGVINLTPAEIAAMRDGDPA